jgi:hypothetical protein
MERTIASTIGVFRTFRRHGLVFYTIDKRTIVCRHRTHFLTVHKDRNDVKTVRETLGASLDADNALFPRTIFVFIPPTLSSKGTLN